MKTDFNFLKSSESLGKKGKFLWSFLRPVVPKRVRWYFEGNPFLHGQLWYCERKLLHETIKKYKPSVCVEIGTWKGGGSTLFIGQALYENKKGILHTIEIYPDYYNESLSNYQKHLSGKHYLTRKGVTVRWSPFLRLSIALPDL